MLRDHASHNKGNRTRSGSATFRIVICQQQDAMRLTTRNTASATILLLSTLCEASKHGLTHLDVLERRHQHHRRLHMSAREEERSVAPEPVLKQRGQQCAFPTDAGLVAVSPDQQNAGWAMSPDQPCMPGNYCPYACPPGQLAMQWNPQATSYTYPLSMVGHVVKSTLMICC